MAWMAAYWWLGSPLVFFLGFFTGWRVFHRNTATGDPDTDKELAELRARMEENEAQRAILRSRLLDYESGNIPVGMSQDDRPAPAGRAAADDPDDLKQIKGIGPQLETVLHEFGIFYFHQIASLSEDRIATIEERMQFRGRISRDGWRSQAAALLAHRQSRLPFYRVRKHQG